MDSDVIEQQTRKVESPTVLPLFTANLRLCSVGNKLTPRLVLCAMFLCVLTAGLRSCAANPAYRLKRIDKSTALMSLVSVPSEM